VEPERSGRSSLKSVDRNLEAEVLARVKAGDIEAFEYFVRTYQKRLFRFVYTLVRDAQEADGITQDVFVKAYRSLASFKEEASFETWMIRIAINTVRDHERRRRPVISFSEVSREEDEGDGGLPRAIDPTDGTSPEREVLSREIRRRINRALISLSPRQRAVFIMKHFGQKSIPEISKAIGLDEGTIKSHLFRAARKLRELLEDLK
jgi:RNA polymerase sigma-70 factor (ECF subfamily)